MSFTSNVNLADLLLDPTESFLSFNENVNRVKSEKQEDAEWLSDEFLDSILTANEGELFPGDFVSTVDSVVSGSEGFDNSLLSLVTDSSDVSNDNTSLPQLNGRNEEFEFVDELFKTPTRSISSISESDGSDQVLMSDANSKPNNRIFIGDLPIICDTTNKDVIVLSPNNASDDEYIVQNSTLKRKPFYHQHRDAQYKGQRIKVVGLKYPTSIRTGWGVKKNQQIAMAEEMILTDDAASDDSDASLKIKLTQEEKRLMQKEGITLPSRFPLTKQEERELKRIRRKIRNKISAQDSRRRKKEYVDGLEERVRRCSEDNARLLKCINQLRTQNVALVNQVRKLQARLAKNNNTAATNQTTQPSTCLLVLFLSLALVLAPSLRNSLLKPASTDDEGIGLNEDETSLNTRSRNLLFSGTSSPENVCAINDEAKAILNELKKLDLSKVDLQSGLQELARVKTDVDNMVLRDHDYFRPRKRASSASSDSGTVSPPPTKMQATRYTQHKHHGVLEVEIDPNEVKKINKTKEMSNTQPVVIDLLD